MTDWPSATQETASDADAELRQGERRIVSVLFADIVGSTERIATLDPEDAQDFLDEGLHRMIENIHAHGGSVTQTLGDGVMAVFGAPAPNEEHALCACLAGIAIRESMDKSDAKAARVRVGIHSGPAIIRWGGNDFGRELKSVGPTVHVAARIEKMCPENGVAISNVTLGLAAAPVKSRKIGRVRDAGDDVTVLELTSVKSKESMDRLIRGRRPNRIVGRDAELGECAQVIRLAHNGLPDSVAFVGEAGFGKSRLVHEATLRAIRANVSCETIRGFAAATSTPFAALRALALRLLGSDKNADMAAALDGLREQGFDRRESLGVLALAGRHVDTDKEWQTLTAYDRNRAILDGVGRAILSRAGRAPLIVIVEDVHFLDRESLGFLNQVRTLQAERPFGVVVTTRPERLDFARSICARVVELAPLDFTAAQSLANAEIEATARKGDESDRVAMIDAVVSRAGGLPLAIEEFARMMRTTKDRRRLHEMMPINLENAFNARLGQLSRASRALAQVASVMGGEFDLELLRVTAGMPSAEFFQCLGELTAQRFLEHIDHGTARFSHQLMQETCYAFTPKARRQTLHAAAHRVFLASADLRHSFHQELARHALGAGDRRQALKHLWDACAEAVGNAAIHSVESLYRQAKAICDDIGPDADVEAAKFTLLSFDAFQQLADQEELLPALEAAKRTMDAANNPHSAVQAETHIALAHMIAGRHKLGIERARRAAEAAGDFLPSHAYAEFTLATLEFANGAARDATARLRRLIGKLSGELATTRFGIAISVPGAMARAFASWYLCYLGEYAEAEQYQRELAETAQQLNHEYSRLLNLIALGYRLFRQRAPDAVETLEMAHDLSVRNAFNGLEPSLSGFYAQALLERGRIGQAQTVMTRSLARGNQLKVRNVNLFYVVETQAKIHAGLGDLESAVAAIDEAIAVSDRNYDPIHSAYGHHSKAQILAKRGEADLARIELLAAAAEAERLGLRPLSSSIAQTMAAL